MLTHGRNLSKSDLRGRTWGMSVGIGMLVGLLIGGWKAMLVVGLGVGLVAALLIYKVQNAEYDSYGRRRVSGEPDSEYNKDRGLDDNWGAPPKNTGRRPGKE